MLLQFLHFLNYLLTHEVKGMVEQSGRLLLSTSKIVQSDEHLGDSHRHIEGT